MILKKQKGTGTFILKAYTSEANNMLITNYAIVTIGDESKEQIALFKETIDNIKASGKSVYRITAFDYSADYLSEDEFSDDGVISEELSEQLEDLFEDGEEMVEIEQPNIPDEIPFVRSDCGQIIVDDYGVIFDAYVKHSEIRMYTSKIGHEDL